MITGNLRYLEAAVRESKEEIGVSGLALTLLFKKKYEDTKRCITKFITTYRAVFDGSLLVDPNEIDRIEYFPMETIRNMVIREEKFHPGILFLPNQYFEQK